MKILYMISNNNSIDLAWSLTELGHKVMTSDMILSSNLTLFEKKEKEECLRELTKDSYDFVITYNFWPMLSHVCQELGMIYVSWVFDSLLLSLYMGEAYNTCNRIFIFDRKEYERIRVRGVKNIWYLPMASNCSRISGLEIADEDIAKYGAQISFVGSLYRKNNEYDLIQPYLHGEREEKWRKRFESMACHWGGTQRDIYHFLDEDDIQFIKECYGGDKNVIGIEDELFYGFLDIAYQLAAIERKRSLECLASRFQVELYTHDDASRLRGVHAHGQASYLDVAQKVFYASKINLQLTIPCIETGISQRVYDIMAVGGFVLSNYQEEYETLFEPDRDVVLFYDLDDMMRKAEYYLSHERERLMIAVNGYRKVNDKHTYLQRVEEILSKLHQV